MSNSACYARRRPIRCRRSGASTVSRAKRDRFIAGHARRRVVDSLRGSRAARPCLLLRRQMDDLELVLLKPAK